jgi:hypothetical protein
MGPDSRYAERFEAWRVGKKELGDLIPSLGTPVLAVVQTARWQSSFMGAFAGFDTGTLRILIPDGVIAQKIKLDHVVELRDTLGDRLANRDRLLRAISARPPFASELIEPIILISGAQQPSLPLDEIKAVKHWDPKILKWVLIGAGVAFDAVLIAQSNNGGFFGRKGL